MNINKESRIVEVFSADLLGKQGDVKEFKDANEYIKELASNPTPNNTYEISQILSYVVDAGLQERMNYLDEIADVKRTDIGTKVEFEIEVEELKAMFQAKSSSTLRSKISNKYVILDNEEVSIRPVVDFYELKSGKVDFNRIARQAVSKLEVAIIKRVQDSVFAAISALSSPNYATGAGITSAVFDPLLFAMQRAGGSASIIGDMEALAKFTALVGSSVPSDYLIEHNRNGRIGVYKGAPLVKLANPFQANSLTNTELDKGYIYVVPTGDASLRPIKVHLEGEVQAIGAPVNIDSKKVEMRFDQYVGVGVVGVRKLIALYNDSAL